MRRKTKRIITSLFITGVMFSIYSIYSDIYPMTDEQYADEAQKIVSDSLPPCPTALPKQAISN
jgi:hypothetical protein